MLAGPRRREDRARRLSASRPALTRAPRIPHLCHGGSRRARIGYDAPMLADRSRARVALAMAAGWSFLSLMVWPESPGKELVWSAFRLLQEALFPRLGDLGWDLGGAMYNVSIAGAVLLMLTVPCVAAIVALIRW